MGLARFGTRPLGALLEDAINYAEAGFNLRPSRPETTYLCVVDEARNVVSYLHSLYAGNGVVAGDPGILLQPDGLLQPR